MFSALRKAAIQPLQDEAEKARVGAFLRAVVYLSTPAIMALELFALRFDPLGRRLGLTAGCLAISMIVLVLVRKERIRAASIWMVGAVWLWLGFMSITSGGLSAPSFSGYVLLVFTTGAVLGAPGALVVGLLSITIQFVFFVAGVNGVLPMVAVGNTPLRHLISNVTILILAAPTVWLVLKSLEDTLRRTRDSERRLADILEFLPDPCLVIDAPGKVKAWNAAMEALTGVAAADMLGKGNYEYALPFYGERRPILADLALLPQEEIERKYARLQRDGDLLSGETYVPALRGGGRYLMATAARLHTADGTVFGAVESIRDLTDLKHVQEQLERAKAAAESASQAKSAFLAMVSHEIRTPMNAILGLSGLLLDGELSSQQREFARTIRSSGEGLLSTLNDILDFSKIEAGRMEVECRPFSVRKCVQSVLDLFEHRCRSKGVALSGVVEASVPGMVEGDSARLWQVLTNLVGNAIKFTDRGEITLSVASRPADDGNHPPPSNGDPPAYELQFVVRDTGIGIPEDRRGRLFQPFSQVDSSTSRKYGGTGLGLVISQRLVGMMGGEIRVESEPGRGSTFSFTILAKGAANSESVSADESWSIPDPGRRRPLQILLAEDNAGNRMLALAVLKRLGCEVTVAVNGLEALEALRSAAFDAVLMDIHMPEMDGLTATREIRRSFPPGRQPWILALSADATADSRPACLSAGMNDYLSKPFEMQDLVAALSRIPVPSEGAAGTAVVPPETPVVVAPMTAAPMTSIETAPSPPQSDGEASTGEGPLLDPAALVRVRSLLGGRVETDFTPLVRELLGSSASMLVKARDALETGDVEELRRAAHSLKNSTMTLGAMRLGGLARELEARARRGCIAGAGTLLDRADEEYAQARDAVERTLAGE